MFKSYFNLDSYQVSQPLQVFRVLRQVSGVSIRVHDELAVRVEAEGVDDVASQSEDVVPHGLQLRLAERLLPVVRGGAADVGGPDGLQLAPVVVVVAVHVHADAEVLRDDMSAK